MIDTGTTIRAVVFDLGGVLVRLGDLTDILGDDPLTEVEFWPLWLASEAVRDFESGRCSAEEFGARMVEEFNLGFSGPELVERFRAWPKGLYPGAAQLISRIREGVRVCALSNSNDVHWHGQTDAAKIRALIDRPFLSHQIGMIKPDREVFAFITSELTLAPSELLFVDDNQINVDAARAAGWNAERTVGPAQAEAHLERYGVLVQR